MTTSNWLTILITLVTSAGTLIAIAVKWGGMLVRLHGCAVALGSLGAGEVVHAVERTQLRRERPRRRRRRRRRGVKGQGQP